MGQSVRFKKTAEVALRLHCTVAFDLFCEVPYGVTTLQDCSGPFLFVGVKLQNCWLKTRQGLRRLQCDDL